MKLGKEEVKRPYITTTAWYENYLKTKKWNVRKSFSLMHSRHEHCKSVSDFAHSTNNQKETAT